MGIVAVNDERIAATPTPTHVPVIARECVLASLLRAHVTFRGSRIHIILDTPPDECVLYPMMHYRTSSELMVKGYVDKALLFMRSVSNI